MLGIPADDVGLVVALPAEARSVGVRGLRAGDCARWRHGWIALSGVGPHNALRAAERLLACGVTRLANWGVAGALDARLAPGDVVLPDRICYRTDAPGFATDADLCVVLGRALAGSLHVRGGTLWSATQPVATRAAKQALAERSGAVAVDMEAAAIAAVAARAKIPFIALKAICDSSVREVPPAITRALDAGGGFSLHVVASILLGGPTAWRAACALAQDFAHARRSLSDAARLAA